MDCRRSNCHFADPLPVFLGSGESLSRVETQAGQPLYMASADLQNAFYTLEMPEELRKFFGLKAVRAGGLGLEELGGRALDPDEWLYPVVRVVPMGWSWALWWCQRVHEKIAERAGLTEAERLRDRHPVSSDRFWHIQYVDNLHVLGTDRLEVRTRFWKAVEALKASGLTVHEIEEGQTEGDSSMKMLGWEIHESGRVAPSRERLWRVRLAIREILRRGAASGQQLERLIGHMTFISLCRREALSVLGECYTFIRRHYQQVVHLWKSVRCELEKWDGIAPLVFADLKRPWSNHLLAVDASEWGLGVTTSNIDFWDTQKLGSISERWRFKDEEARNPRQFVIAEDERSLGHFPIDRETPRNETIEDLQSNKCSSSSRSFKTVGFEVVDRSWQVVGRYRWQRKESMPVYEARASLHAIQHHLRNLENFGKKHVILTDSMTAAVAFDKGRAQGFRLRRAVQQTAALSMASLCLFRMRWIPSEWNPADGPSRGKWGPTTPSRELSNDPSATWGGGDMPEQEKQTSGRTITATGSPDRGDASDLGHRARSGKEARGDKESTTGTEKEERFGGQSNDLERSVGDNSNEDEISGAVVKLRAMGKAEGEATLEEGVGGAFASRSSDGQDGGRLPRAPLHEWGRPQCG